MNAGTIVEEPMLKVRLLRKRPSKTALRPGAERPGLPIGGSVLGQIEEYFIEQLRPGDTFLFAGHVLRFETLVETVADLERIPWEHLPLPPPTNYEIKYAREGRPIWRFLLRKRGTG